MENTNKVEDQKKYAMKLRRVLYLMQLMRFNLLFLKLDESTPGGFQQDIQNIFNSCNRMVITIRGEMERKKWEQFIATLTKDQMDNINLLLDALAEVNNIGDVVSFVNENKIIETDPEATANKKSHRIKLMKNVKTKGDA